MESVLGLRAADKHIPRSTSQAKSGPREGSIVPLTVAPAGSRSTTPTINGTTPVSSSPAIRIATVASISEPTDAELSTETAHRPSIGGAAKLPAVLLFIYLRKS